MTTILPDLPPSRRPSIRLRTVGVPVLVVALGLGAATAARALTAKDAPRLAQADRPGGQQQPLAETATVRTAAGTLSVDLPGPARYVRTTRTDEMLLGAAVGPGGRASTAVLVVEWKDRPPNPDAFLAEMRADNPAAFKPGPTRHTKVGPYAASEADMAVGERVLREYRFVANGVLLGVGILTNRDDQAGLDTALAAIATLRVD